MDAQFTFEDFYSQLQQVKKMGPLGDLLKMIPGLGGIAKQLPEGPEAEHQMRRIEAIISSMTRAERADPALINGSRRRPIRAGPGAAGVGGEPAREAIRRDGQDDETEGV